MVFKRVGIVDSGTMGAGIAEVAAVHGHEVVLRSRSHSSAEATVASLESSLDRQVEKERCTGEERDQALGRVTVTTDFGALCDVDVVIESIVEDMGAKRHLFDELDRVCDERAVLATNTSTLPVVELAMETGRPDRVCGIHFFNPAPLMSLVEVVRPITASDETIAAACAFAKACGKEPVEGGTATKEGIDTAIKGGCGFPMGPFALLDLVGLDTSVAILDALYAEYRDQHYAPAPLLRRMIAAEQLGRKSEQGFYSCR